jgi:hypothetical protein
MKKPSLSEYFSVPLSDKIIDVFFAHFSPLSPIGGKKRKKAPPKVPRRG